jgi:hypothetical protein
MNIYMILFGICSFIWGVLVVVFYKKFARLSTWIIGYSQDFQEVHAFLLGIVCIIVGVITIIVELT